MDEIARGRRPVGRPVRRRVQHYAGAQMAQQPYTVPCFGWLTDGTPVCRQRPPLPPPDVLLTLRRAGPGRWWLRGHGVRSGNLDFVTEITTAQLVEYPKLRKHVARAVGIMFARVSPADWAPMSDELLRPIREYEHEFGRSAEVT